MAWSGEGEIVNQFDKFIYSHPPANEPKLHWRSTSFLCSL